MSRTYKIRETSKSIAVLRNNEPVVIFDKNRRCWFSSDAHYHGNTRRAIARYRKMACDAYGLEHKPSVCVHPGIFRSLGGGKVWNN